MARTALVLLG